MTDDYSFPTPKFKKTLARNAFIIILALVLAPMLILSMVGYNYQRDLILSQYEDSLKNVVEIFLGPQEALLDETNQQIENSLINVPGFVEAIDQAAKVSGRTKQFASAREIVVDKYYSHVPAMTGQQGGFLIIDPEGTVFLSSMEASLGDSSLLAGETQNDRFKGTNLVSESYYQKLAQSDGKTIAVYGPGTIFSSQLNLLTINHIRDDDGNLKWTLLSFQGSGSALTVLEKLNTVVPESRAFYVVGPQEKEVLGLDKQGYLVPVQISTEERNILLESDGGDQPTSNDMSVLPYTTRGLNGERVQLLVFKLPGLAASIVLEIPGRSVAEPIKEMRTYSFAMYGITITIAALVTGFVLRQFSRALSELTEKTSLIAKGNFNQRVNIQSKNELGLLAFSFNKMATDLGTLYKSIQAQVEERTQQVRIAAEVAQGITTASSEKLLHYTAELIVETFDLYHAGIFMLDPAGQYATLEAAQGPSKDEMLAIRHQLEVGSDSIVGWASANNKPRVVPDVDADSIHRYNPLLPETKSEAGIPISSGDRVLGILDVQSKKINAFDEDTIITLQTIANQLAAAIQNVGLIEAAKVDLREMEYLYRGGRQITKAQTEEDVVEAAKNALEKSPHAIAIYIAREDHLELVLQNVSEDDPALGEMTESKLRTTDYLLLYTVSEKINMSPDEVLKNISGSSMVTKLSQNSPVPHSLTKIARQMKCNSAAYLPMLQDDHLVALVIIGDRDQESLSASEIQPYINMIDMASTVLGKISADKQTQKRIGELQSLAALSRAMGGATEINSYCAALHEQISKTIGDYDISIALYNSDNNTVEIPYKYENGIINQISPFALIDSLISILVNTREPQLLSDNLRGKATELGINIVGSTPKSWMGAPMIVQNKVIGAIIVEDSTQEKVFNQDNLLFITSLAAQAAGAIYNTRLAEESRQAARQLETAARIARDVSSSLDLDELLQKAIQLMQEHFNFYHASVFIVDAAGEYAVVREATGEAGAQMKRTGHKLGVGSKSIIGYVTGQGEALVVNNTEKDTTHKINPLLPETRAEAAVPLKIGVRVLGALDVQSTQAYAFTDEAINTLQILADQLAVAVVNTELFAETQEHLSQHRLLHHIVTSAASGTTLGEALESAVKGLEVTLGGDRVAILLYDKAEECLKVVSSVGYSADVINSLKIPKEKGISGWVAAHRMTQRVDDVTKDPRYIEASANTRSELATPLVYRKELLGVLNVESEQVSAYNEHDEELLGTLGGSLAAIIANTRLLEQIRSKSERERMLYEVTSKIRQTTDMQRIVTTTAKEINKALGARRAQIKISLQESDSNNNQPIDPGNGKNE
ncbi:MAG: GAF domain-containing protein [Anaerolineales bacterium]|nr:GAF domain-containing protein [Anaerolineales bacterium]